MQPPRLHSCQTTQQQYCLQGHICMPLFSLVNLTYRAGGTRPFAPFCHCCESSFSAAFSRTVMAVMLQGSEGCTCMGLACMGLAWAGAWCFLRCQLPIPDAELNNVQHVKEHMPFGRKTPPFLGVFCVGGLTCCLSVFLLCRQCACRGLVWPVRYCDCSSGAGSSTQSKLCCALLGVHTGVL